MNQSEQYNQELQQVITNAVHSALLQSGIKSPSEAVSTASSFSNSDILIQRACERRLKNLRSKYNPNK